MQPFVSSNETVDVSSISNISSISVPDMKSFYVSCQEVVALFKSTQHKDIRCVVKSTFAV